MKLVYIAGPYRANNKWQREINIQRAREHGARLIEKLGELEYFPIVPHANTAHMDDLQSERYFLLGTLEQLKHCEYIYLMPNWKKSEGAKAEWEFAKKNGIKRLRF